LKIMLSSGEASGDLHGANLARELRKQMPEVELFGMGGPLMEKAGVRLLFNPTEHSVMGFVEVIRSVQVLRRVLERLGEALAREKPDALVVVDFPDFNMRLAAMAATRGVPVVYYISPSVWAWRRGRAQKIGRMVKCVCCIFPFEAQVYREAGAPVCYVGHPLLDVVKSSVPPRDFLRELGLNPDAPFFALLPGSRNQEIRSLFPAMLQAAAIIAREVPGAQFGVPVAHTLNRRIVEEFAGQAGVPPVAVCEGRTYDMLAAAEVAIIASGTATLEAAILGTPHVMVYRMAAASYRLAKMLVHIEFAGLPNIVAGRKVVEELLQQEANAERMAAELLALWRDADRRRAMKEGLAEVVARLGQTGAVHRAAQAVLAAAQGADPLAYGLPLPPA
jgi:lipid-A-disaccharide synthase